MEGIYIPLLSALAGAVIGSATSIITILIQGSRDERRQLRELAAKLALDDYKEHLAMVRRRGGSVYPIAAYLAHHLRVLEASAGGSLTVERFRKIIEQDEELRGFLREKFPPP